MVDLLGKACGATAIFLMVGWVAFIMGILPMIMIVDIVLRGIR
jgi:hypothetical protein